ncbi:DUF2865 domain-containing protein [Nitratireductor sp. GISD-1A_MAKvit]|uniref:DUF2865 domain-containing protein n=1 Tax=Nitratireductor sp. GISD-1A_MAKvit TaxID=3234198 RepID=UPI0034654EE9
MRKGGDTIWKTGLACLVLIVGMAALTLDAAAKSKTCRKLEARLATVSGASPAQAKRYDRAIAKQSQQLKILRGQMRKASCGFGLFSSQARQCAALKRSEGKMKSNLAKLRKQRSRIGGGSAASRKRIEASLKKHGCGNRPERTKKKSTGKRITDNKAKQPQRPGSVYQTMCVRLCDGYYFPISFSVSKKHFPRDAKTCEARCPGAEVALYTHDVQRETPEEMVSAADGSAYLDLPKAFSYRRTGIRKKICGCQRPKNFKVIAGEKSQLVATPAGEEQKAQTSAETAPSGAGQERGSSFHVARSPERDARSKSHDGARKKQDEESDRTSSVAPEARQTPRRVRIVGPAFLPDPEEAIDLRAPAPAPAP